MISEGRNSTARSSASLPSVASATSIAPGVQEGGEGVAGVLVVIGYAARASCPQVCRRPGESARRQGKLLHTPNTDPSGHFFPTLYPLSSLTLCTNQ